MSDHFVLKCKKCKKVIAQCRCMDCNKTIKWGYCQECQDKSEPAESASSAC